MGGKGSGSKPGKPNDPNFKPLQNRVNFEPGDNTRMLKQAIEGFKHERVDTKDPQAISQRILEYLTYCMENDTRPLVGGCANWLGVDTRTLENWYSGRTGTPEHQAVLARFYGVIKALWDEYMQNGKINPVAGIYISKVYFGYKDTQEIVINDKSTEQKGLGVAELIEQAKLLPGAQHLNDAEGTVTVED